MTISQIKYQKAIIDYGGRHWVAWFSPDIPIINGPYKFTGLPGLIIRIGDTKDQFSFLIKIRRLFL